LVIGAALIDGAGNNRNAPDYRGITLPFASKETIRLTEPTSEREQQVEMITDVYLKRLDCIGCQRVHRSGFRKPYCAAFFCHPPGFRADPAAPS
jgi:hypothetical protein